MSLGSQLQMASQTIVVSRALGLEQAVVWSVGTKMFNLIVILMGRPFGAAIPVLYEIYARNEMDRLKARFKGIVVLTASLGAFLGISFALCNSLFINCWVGGKIAWSPLNDVLLGFWLFLLSLATTHVNLVNVTKKIGGMRYVLFMEGCGFILLAMFFGCRWGIPGMVATSIVCTLAFCYQYSLRRSREVFHCSFAELAFEWVGPSLKLAGVFAAVAVVVSLLDIGLPTLWRLVIHAAVAGLVGGILFLRLGFPEEMIREAGARLPRPAARILEAIVH